MTTKKTTTSADSAAQARANARSARRRAREFALQGVYAWLLRGGELNPMLQKVGTSVQPRVAIGMVEPYHYKVLLVEGRHKNSKGVSCEWMACKMLDMGCTVAFNLDGGQTSALMFMGVKINTSGSYQGRSGYRTLSGMIGAGVSEQVPPFKD